MNNFHEINFYYVKSDFNYIANSLVKNLSDQKVIINLVSTKAVNIDVTIPMLRVTAKPLIGPEP